MHSTFQQPTDGLYHIAALGDHPHKAAGLVQVIDKASLKAIVDSFREAQQDSRFPGVLVDYDHASLDADKPSEAAGWICDLQVKEDGLYAAIRWTDKGSEAIEGGRYRYISPVFKQCDCEVLENNRVRPKRLLNCALTNDPNLVGLSPLTNRGPMDDEQRKAMFARMAQGGGGPGGGGGGPAAQAPAPAPAAQPGPAAAPAMPGEAPAPAPTPETPALPPAGYTLSSPKLTELKEQRADLATMRPERPAEPIDPRVKVNPAQVFKDTLRATNNINAAREAEAAAQADADQRRAALAEIRAPLRRQGLRGDKLDKAIDREIERELKQHDQAVKQFDRKLSSHERAMNRLDLQVATEEMRLAVADDKQTAKDWAAVQKEMAAQVKAELAAIREKAKSDAAKAKQDAAQAKATEAAAKEAAKIAAAEAKKNDPYTQDRAHLSKVRQYAAAVERGDFGIADRMIPGGPHKAFQDELKSAKPKDRSRLIAETAAALRT